MSQSTVIVAAIVAAFVVWVTLNGHLANYLAFLGFGTATASTSGNAVVGP